MLYFLLTGRPPFVGRDTDEVWDRARRGVFDRDVLGKPGVPGRLARVALRAMTLDPEDRYPTAVALATDLEAFLRRPRRVAAQSGVLLLAATAVGVWSLWPQPGRETDRLVPQARAPSSPTLEPVPLKVETFQVELHRRSTKSILGLVGLSAFAGRFEDDQVRVRARLSAPGFCYVLTLRTGRPAALGRGQLPDRSETRLRPDRRGGVAGVRPVGLAEGAASAGRMAARDGTAAVEADRVGGRLAV